MSIRRRAARRASAIPPRAPAPQPDQTRATEQEPPIPVRLHPAVAVSAPVLATHLGPGFEVQVADTCSDGVFVVPGQAFVRQAGEWTGRAQTAVLVLVSPGTPPQEIARVLDQGADGCLAGSHPPLVAGQVLALARRVLHRPPPQP